MTSETTGGQAEIHPAEGTQEEIQGVDLKTWN
jgi:hypothetical protein